MNIIGDKISSDGYFYRYLINVDGTETFKSVIVTTRCIETMLHELRPKQLKTSTPISMSFSIYKQTIISVIYLKYYYVGQRFDLYFLVEYLVSYYTHTFQSIYP